jgi:hypothetical protein
MLKICYLVAISLLLSFSASPAQADGGSWFFTAQELEIAYRYQERFGKRLHRPLKPVACFNGNTEFLASFEGKEFLAPCSFIIETIRHLKQILEKGAAKYLFPLDADHAHLAVPLDVWNTKFRDADPRQILPALLREPTLLALYHTAEHLTELNPKTGKLNADARLWKQKRNVIGFYDGRSIIIMPPQPHHSGSPTPDGYHSCATLHFSAHRLGEVIFVAKGKAVAIDLSFDNDLAASARDPVRIKTLSQ